MSAIFYDDDILAEYELNEQWDESLEYLHNLMYSKPKNKSVLYRLATQCWYVLTFWDCDMPKEKLKRKIFELELENAYVSAKEQWWSDPDCLWLFGYLMCINQIDFPYISTDISIVEEKGNELIFKAYTSDPDNLLAKALYLADNGNKHEYMEVLKKVKKNINNYFPRKSAVEKYFSEIFTIEHRGLSTGDGSMC